jgi:hypothetical protein
MRVKDLKKGQRIIERDFGFWCEAEVVADSVFSEKTGMFECKVKYIRGDTPGSRNEDGTVTLAEVENPGAYGLNLELVG